jgi:hypothetical protein
MFLQLFDQRLIVLRLISNNFEGLAVFEIGETVVKAQFVVANPGLDCER